MLTIRLQRLGKKNNPTYRLIVSEKGRDTQGKHVEILGSYNPHNKNNELVAQTERILYWIGKGAQTSNTVHNLLLKAGIINSAPKKKAVFISKERAVKLAEKKKNAQPASEIKPEEKKE
ncbi:MAG: 30S ribosomal protein S16 [Patescibacteria group bacterium]